MHRKPAEKLGDGIEGRYECRAKRNMPKVSPGAFGPENSPEYEKIETEVCYRNKPLHPLEVAPKTLERIHRESIGKGYDESKSGYGDKKKRPAGAIGRITERQNKPACRHE